jgi:hypothetical protein
MAGPEVRYRCRGCTRPSTARSSWTAALTIWSTPSRTRTRWSRPFSSWLWSPADHRDSLGRRIRPDAAVALHPGGVVEVGIERVGILRDRGRGSDARGGNQAIQQRVQQRARNGGVSARTVTDVAGPLPCADAHSWAVANPSRVTGGFRSKPRLSWRRQYRELDGCGAGIPGCVSIVPSQIASRAISACTGSQSISQTETPVGVVGAPLPLTRRTGRACRPTASRRASSSPAPAHLRQASGGRRCAESGAGARR